MDESAMPAQIEEQHAPSFFSKYKFTIISLCVILVALIPLIVLYRQHKAPATSPVAVVVPSPTPTPIPLTQQNAQPTLSATDQQVQSAVAQSNQDLNSVSQIDSSQDSVAGL